MNKHHATGLAALFAASALVNFAYAQPGEQKKQQVHEGTPEAGTVQKKDQKKAQKKDGAGAAKADAASK